MTIRNVQEVLVHALAHLDEVAAFLLLKYFGEEKFPGVGTAKISFWGGAEGTLVRGKNWQENLNQGTLAIGIGDGPLNEHALDGRPRKKDECATTLVAKYLGIEGDPAVAAFCKLILDRDQNPVIDGLDLSRVAKVGYQFCADGDLVVFRWMMQGIEWVLQKLIHFHGPTKNEFLANAKIHNIVVPNDKNSPFRTAVIVSDNEQISVFSRTKTAGYCAVTIQKNGAGQVQIYTNAHYQFSIQVMKELIKLLRLEEQELAKEVKVTDWGRLEAEGKISEVPEWYVDFNMKAIFNGSLTYPDVPATRVSLERIVELLKIALGAEGFDFESSRAAECQKGNCTSSSHSSCSWYKFGLMECRQIRNRQREKQLSKPVVV